ncbi:MAG TPA: arylsulfatase [Lacipirellula sp.]
MTNNNPPPSKGGARGGISEARIQPLSGNLAQLKNPSPNLSPQGRGIAICLIACVFATCLNTAQAAEQHPNIILIIADDLGVGELGCYGQRYIQTPHIDQLAAEGMRFTQFYAGAPVCAPSRCTLMTGKHLGHAAVRNNKEKGPWKRLAERYGTEFTGQQPLPADEVTLAEALKARGYATAAIGKWGLGHFGTTGDPNQQGFDLFYGYNCQRHAHNHYPEFLWRNDQKETLPGNASQPQLEGQTYSQDKFIENALEFIRENRDGPFFLYLPVTIPHLSIQVPAESLAQYEGKIPESPVEPRKGHPYHYLNHPAPHAGYAAMVSHMDRGVGQIVELVNQLGLDENTIILFTSDNGPTYDRLGGADSDFFNSTLGLRGRKGDVYEGGLRVPLVVRWPGVTQQGSQTDAVAAMWDLLPTLCEAAGAETPKPIDGLSLVSVLKDPSSKLNREYLYWEFPNRSGQQAVRMGNWKGVRTDLAKGPQRWQLYDLSVDETEAHDVAGEHPNIVKQIDRLAAEAHVPSETFPLQSVDAR